MQVQCAELCTEKYIFRFNSQTSPIKLAFLITISCPSIHPVYPRVHSVADFTVCLCKPISRSPCKDCMHRTRGHPVVLLDMICISPSPCGAPPCNHALVPGLHYSRRHQLLIFTLPGVHASHSSRLPHPLPTLRHPDTIPSMLPPARPL